MRAISALLVSLLSIHLPACAVDPPPRIDDTVQAIEGSAEEVLVGADLPDRENGHCSNAGSMPTTGPKGGESIPGSEDDPQGSSAHMAASVQGPVQIDDCSYPPNPAPDRVK